MDEKRKKIIAITVCVLFVIAVFSLGWVLSRHYGNLESSNGNDVRTTVRNTLKGSMKTLKENSMKQSKLLKEQSQQIKTLKEQLTASRTQTMNSQDSMQKTKTLLNEQNKSLTTLTEQINKESHKRMVAQRQRDTWAVLAGIFICSSAYKTLN